MIPADLRYTEAHEWLRLDGHTGIVGITDYAQDQLTDIVFVELPEVGRKVDAGDAAAVLESVKSVADVYAPVAGEVVEINKALEEHPEYVNESPYDNGWIFKLKANSGDASHLLDAKGYRKFLDAQEH